MKTLILNVTIVLEVQEE